MLFHQSPCKKSQKGVYLYYQTLQNGADDIIMKRQIISYSLIGRRKEMMRYHSSEIYRKLLVGKFEK